MINKLTPEQTAKFNEYVKEGIRIGLDTNQDFDLDYVTDLANKHRIMLGKKKATIVKVYDSPMEACSKIPGLSPSSALYGQHDISWLNYYMLYRKELGLVKETEPLVYLYELAKHVGWMWMSDDAIIFTKKPYRLSLVPGGPAGTLHPHDFNKMALEYPDGRGVYCIRGVRIPAKYTKFIELSKEEINPAEVLQIDDVNIRALFIDKIGIETIFDYCDASVLDSDTIVDGRGKEHPYELVSIQIPGLDERSTALKMVNPSTGDLHVEGVDDRCRTVKQALHWRVFKTILANDNDYIAPMILT